MATEALYRQADLAGALEACMQEIKALPADIGKRALFAELLCIQGDFERADQQLETLLALEPRSLITVGSWRQLVRAAAMRVDVFEHGALPELVEPASPHMNGRLELLSAMRTGVTDLGEITARLESQRPPSPCLVNGQPVNDLRDVDDRFAGVVELFASNGKYFWVEQQMIMSIAFHTPERAIDVHWRRAEIVLRSGTVGQVAIPTVYPAVYPAAQPAAAHPAPLCDKARLGRITEWQDHNGMGIGVGQRILLAGDADLALSDINSIEFQHP